MARALPSLSPRFRGSLVGGPAAAAVLVAWPGRVSAVRHIGVVPSEPPVPTGLRAEGTRPLGAVPAGGVIDDPPIRYATRFEGCALLFIFPLHASFEERHSERSILRRAGRVMEVRQEEPARSRAAARVALEELAFDTADGTVRMQAFGPGGRPSESHDFKLR